MTEDLATLRRKAKTTALAVGLARLGYPVTL